MNTTESAWEQRVGTAAQALIIACLVWVGNSTVSIREEVVSLKVHVANATAKLEQIQVLQSQLRELEYLHKETVRRLVELETRRVWRQ